MRNISHVLWKCTKETCEALLECIAFVSFKWKIWTFKVLNCWRLELYDLMSILQRTMVPSPILRLNAQSARLAKFVILEWLSLGTDLTPSSGRRFVKINEVRVAQGGFSRNPLWGLEHQHFLHIIQIRVMCLLFKKEMSDKTLDRSNTQPLSKYLCECTSHQEKDLQREGLSRQH
jgi:hypothetical protein